MNFQSGLSKSAFVPARRMEGVSESATLRLNALVQKMRAEGEDVVNLTTGEPDFDVPEAAKEAAIDAIKKNRSKYTPAAGIPELRAKIAARINAQQPSLQAVHPWTAADIVVTNGAKQAIFQSLLALVDEGDQVLIPAPYWLSYPEMAKLASGKSMILPTLFEEGYILQAAELEKALQNCASSGTRARILFLNSPSNPTGGMYSRNDFRRLGDIILKSPFAQDLWVISDEIYDRIVYGDVAFCSFLEACPELRDRVITVNGLSKSAAMTGWRVGWSVAPPSIQSSLVTLQGQSTSGINSVAQWASLAALDLPEETFADQIRQYRERRDLVLAILGQSGKLRVFSPLGAFYAWVDVRGACRTGEDSGQFSERLLSDGKVAVVPGDPFGGSGCIRISFAANLETLRKGCERFVRLVEA